MYQVYEAQKDYIKDFLHVELFSPTPDHNPTLMYLQPPTSHSSLSSKGLHPWGEINES